MAGLLFALSPFAVAYAQEARSYSLVCLLVTAGSWLLLRRIWTWWAIVMALAVYAHLFAVLVLAAHLLFLLLARVPVRDWGKSATWLALALVPTAAFVLLKNAGQLNWIPPLSLSQMKDAFGELAGGGDLALAIFFLGILGAVITWRGPVRENRTMLIWLWLLLPAGVIVAISGVHPILIARFLMISLPALLLAAGIALSEVPKLVSALLLVAIVFFSVRTELLAWRAPVKDDWRAATAYVLANSSPQDGVVFHQALGRQPFEYYASREHATSAPQVISPAHGSRLTYRDFEGDPEAKLAAKLRSAPPVLWVLLDRNEPKGVVDEQTKFLMSVVERRYGDCKRKQFRGVTVMRCGS
jgi:mannosyltransferase